jgi:hypothetical protein
MLKDPITILVQSTVSGPSGIKLKHGEVAVLEDSPYVRILVKSGAVSLIDPPSLDPDFLREGGYELREGYHHPVKDDKKDSSKKKEEKKEDKPEHPHGGPTGPQPSPSDVPSYDFEYGASKNENKSSPENGDK